MESLRTVVVGFFLIISLLGIWVFKSPHPRQKEKPFIQQGNDHIKKFHAAKKIAKNIYGNSLTFYCGCQFTDKSVDHSSCGYQALNPNGIRAQRIEWEHIVPASKFGRNFSSWKNGHPHCQTKAGRKYKGRRCTRKVSKTFRKMEADLYNLVPVIGEVNAIRSNSSMGILSPDTLPLFGECMTKIKDRRIEPRRKIRGFIARTYKYMNSAYPGHNVISKENRKLFNSWDRLYPPNKKELIRAQKIQRIQKNKNKFVLEWAKLKQQKG